MKEKKQPMFPNGEVGYPSFGFSRFCGFWLFFCCGFGASDFGFTGPRATFTLRILGDPKNSNLFG
jgi:hypothetical protein